MIRRALPIFMLASLLTCIGLAQAKPKTAEAAIVGAWHVDANSITIDGKKGTAAPAGLKTVIDQLQKLHITFKSDHTYAATGYKDGVHKGKWSLRGKDVVSQRDGQTQQTVAHLQREGSLRIDVTPKVTEYLVRDGKSR